MTIESMSEVAGNHVMLPACDIRLFVNDGCVGFDHVGFVVLVHPNHCKVLTHVGLNET